MWEENCIRGDEGLSLTAPTDHRHFCIFLFLFLSVLFRSIFVSFCFCFLPFLFLSVSVPSILYNSLLQFE